MVPGRSSNLELGWGYKPLIPSGKLTELLKMAIEIVDLPIKNVIFHSYVSLPEGKYFGDL